VRDADLVPSLQKELAAYKPAGPDDPVQKEYQIELAYARQQALTDQSIAQALDSIDLRNVDPGTALSVLGLVIRKRYYDDRHMSAAAQSCFAGFDTLDVPQ